MRERIKRIFISAQTAERMARGTVKRGTATASTNPHWNDAAYVRADLYDEAIEALKATRDKAPFGRPHAADKVLAAIAKAEGA